MAAWLLSSAAAEAEEASGFTLETGSPDALCPALEVTREAVMRRLGALVVEGRWRARYSIAHAPSGTPRDFVRLELFNPDGAIELVRDLPIAGESCRTMADVIALVLDRYFRGLDAEDVESERAPAPMAERVPPPRSLPPHPSPPAMSTTRSAPQAVLERRLALEYAVSHPDALPWLGLRGSAAFGSRFELSLALRVALGRIEERTPRGATVQAQPALVRAGVAWRLALPPAIVHVGPLLQLTLEQPTTRGLATPNDRTRAEWSAGLEGGFVAPVGRRVFVHAALSAEILVGSGRFYIQEREVLVPPALTVGGSFGFGYSY